MTLNHIPSPSREATPSGPMMRWLPFVLLGGFGVAALVALGLPLRLPLGAFYWDVAVYVDAFHRIHTGQMPAVDFFAPVGPLGYYLGATLHGLFATAQPMLLTNWAILPIVLPLAFAVLAQPDARRHGLGLVLPFIVFALLPVNLAVFYPTPGLDGFGIYNRHTALLLYWLIATLLFVRSPKVQAILVTAFMLALFLTKITGAVSGAILVGYACLVGRMRWREAVLAAIACIAALLLIDLSTGLIRAYVADILTLLSLNTGTLLPRLLTVASAKFGVVLPACALIVLLFWGGLRDGPGSSVQRFRRLLAEPAGWLAASLFALALFETQNTGSLEFIGLWPVLLLVLTQWRGRVDALKPAIVALALAIALPSLMLAIERGARALAGTAGDAVVLKAPELGPLGRVTLRRGLAERAAAMVDFYPRHAATYQALAAQDLEPSALFHAEIDQQAAWLLEVRQGVLALQDWERQSGRRLDSLFTLDFVEPFNALLGRRAPREVPLGIVPDRNLPPLTQNELAQLARTDAVLAPKCPVTPARAALAAHYAALLAGREKIALSGCWDMYLRNPAQ